MPTPQVSPIPLLDAVVNLSRCHREHEKFYATEPRESAVRLQRHSRTLLALADRWSTSVDGPAPAPSPFAGADDLNANAATQLDGVLFMEGEGEPVEISRLKADLARTADELDATGEWLARAMQASWDVAPALFAVAGLADVLGERHRIIANDWLAAHMSVLAARILHRAVTVLEQVDFTPAALRADLAGTRRAPAWLYSSAEMISRAADMLSDSAGLVHDNERRWRVFHARVATIVADAALPPERDVP